jgi:hypothetical protein
MALLLLLLLMLYMSLVVVSINAMFRWGAVLRLVACVGLLFFFLGLSAMGGIGLLIITLPLNNVSKNFFKRFIDTTYIFV